MRRKNLAFPIACVVAAIAGLSGCSAVTKCKEFFAAHPDIRPIREERARDVAASYDRRRDELQMQAALASWRQGNPEGCRELLASLLLRNPKHREAQLLQIEIALVQENLTEAKQRGTALLEQLPKDAEVAHVAALVFDASGEEAQALTYFRRATELEPDNQVYAASYSTASAPEASADPAKREKAVIGRSAATRKPTRNATSAKAPSSSFVLLEAQLCLTLDDSTKARRLLEDLLTRQPQLADAQAMLREAIDPRLRATANERPTDMRRDWRWQDLALTSWPVAARTESAELEVTVAVVHEEAEPSKKLVRIVGDSEPESSRPVDPALVTDDEPAATDGMSTQEKRSLAAAVAALRQHRPELAIDLAVYGLDATPDSAALYRTIGTAEYSRGDYEAARIALQESLALDKIHPLSYFLMGCTLRQLGQPDEAERYLLRARQLDSRYAQEPPR